MVICGCSVPEKVIFKDPVDTSNKLISYQLKKTYGIDGAKVYASNQFDSARLNDFTKLNDSTALVHISPENEPINNSPYYAFKTWSDYPTTFYYKFYYPIGYKHRYIPKIKKGDKWNVLDSSKIFKTDSIVTIKLNLTNEPIIVAAQEIQNSNQVKQWYTNLVNENSHNTSLKIIGKSSLGKDLPVLDVFNGSKEKKPIIILLTRQHPPEVTGYFAFQEFLSTILDNSDLSKTFLNNYRVLAFPILNPDGVDLGHWRHNAEGIDTNRDWSQYNQTEIKQVVKFISKTLKRDRAKLIIGLDFHSTWYDVFYTNDQKENTTLPTFVNDWFFKLEENIPNYKVNEASGNSTKPVSKGWFLYGHNAVGITYEIGDTTPKENIKLIGKTSAEQMMKILTNQIITN